MIAKRAVVSWFFVVAAVTGITCAPHGEPQRSPTSAGDKIEVTQPTAVVPAAFKDRIDAALAHVSQRPLLTTHSFWTILHGILGMGPDEAMLVDPETQKHFKAIDYVCKGAPIRGMVFMPMGNAGVDVQTQAGSGVGQGHQDQFVAEMTQWGMPLDRKFLIGGKEYSFGDFVRYSKERASVAADPPQELSWAIVIIAQHYGTDARWTNQAGEKLAFEDLVRYELNQPIEDAACGGTHRLFGLTWAYHLHLKKGGKTAGVWQDVADKIDLYKKQARKFQNPDRSFSTSYVSEPGDIPDKQLRIATTGHVLEWLSLALTKEELSATWMQEAANALVMMILESRSDPIDGGALYHAVHGLHIYRARVFGTPTPGLLIP